MHPVAVSRSLRALAVRTASIPVLARGCLSSLTRGGAPLARTRGQAIAIAMIVCIALLIPTSTAKAQSYTWWGATDGDWQNASNWSGHVKPTSPLWLVTFGNTSHANITNANDDLTFGPMSGNVFFGSDAPSYRIAGTGSWTFGSGGSGDIRDTSSQGQTIELDINVNGGMLNICTYKSLTIGTRNNTINLLGSESQLRLNGGGAINIESSISGTGYIQKWSNGIATLSGNNTYTGPTQVFGGTLIVNGSLASNVFVDRVGTLGGSGTIGSLTVDGTIAPGNSIGTLRVNGNYTHNSDATYAVEINDHGGSDLIRAAGTATLNGGTVSVQAQSGTYTLGMRYRILQAGSVTGAFDSVTDNLPFLNGRLLYGLDYVDLMLVRGPVPYTDVAQTQNQFDTALYLDRLYAGATGDLATVMGALDSLSASDARVAFDQISGEPYADLAAIDISGSNLFTDTAFYRLCNGADLDCASLPGRRLWAYGLGDWERQHATSSNAGWDSYGGYSNQIAGFMAGCDNQFDNVLVGFGGGYGRSDVRFLDTTASDRTDLFNFSLYGKAEFGAAYLAAVAGYTHGWNNMDRDIQFDGLAARHAAGTVDGNVFGSFFQAGYNIRARPLAVDAHRRATVRLRRNDRHNGDRRRQPQSGRGGQRPQLIGQSSWRQACLLHDCANGVPRPMANGNAKWAMPKAT